MGIWDHLVQRGPIIEYVAIASVTSLTAGVVLTRFLNRSQQAPACPPPPPCVCLCASTCVPVAGH